MSTPGPDDSPPQTSDELGGLDPKDLFNAALETVPPVTLPPQPADPDATAFVTPSSTGIKLDARQELPLPEELTQLLPAGAYKVESFLGQGGMGAVYKGTQVRLKRPVAIKIMRRDFGKDHDFEARFEREAQAMAKLNHPNIVSVIDFGEAGPDYLYIVMELIDGADVMDVIRTGRMTQEMALTLLPQICDALQFAHDHGIVHRDIKPSNIMLTRDGRIKMADFGLAKRYDAESSFRTQTGTGMGTPDYAAPEQFDPAAQIDHRADIYALGVMIYQMITGQLPHGVWKPPSQRAEVAPQWDEIVGRAMQSDPADRYQKATEVKMDVSSISLARLGMDQPERGQPELPQSGASPDPNKKVSSKPRSRAPLILGLAAAVIIFSIVSIVLPRSSAPGITPDADWKFRIWGPIFTEAEWRASETGRKLHPDGWLQVTSARLTKRRSSGDNIIRTRIWIKEGTSSPAIIFRQPETGEEYRALLEVSADLQVVGVALEHRATPSAKAEILAVDRRSRLFVKDAGAQLEVRVAGAEVTVKMDGIARITAKVPNMESMKEWGISATEGWFWPVQGQDDSIAKDWLDSQEVSSPIRHLSSPIQRL